MNHYPWAVVTGASAGIGEAYARLLAAKGTNLILAARRLDRLNRLASELPVETRAVQADLTLDEDRDRLWEEVESVAGGVSLLVNNAGFGLLGDFGELDRRRQLQMVEINVVALTDLAHRFITHRRRSGGGGALVNNASVVGLKPVHLHAVYSATKAYVVSFSQTLAGEVRGDQIRVQALCPGPVPTEFQEISGVVLEGRTKAVVISAEQTAEESLQGLAADRKVVIPGARLRTIMRLFRLLPADLASWISEQADLRRSP